MTPPSDDQTLAAREATDAYRALVSQLVLQALSHDGALVRARNAAVRARHDAGYSRGAFIPFLPEQLGL